MIGHQTAGPHAPGSRLLIRIGTVLLTFAIVLAVSGAAQAIKGGFAMPELLVRLFSTVLATATIFFLGFLVASSIVGIGSFMFRRRVPAAFFDALAVAIVLFLPSAMVMFGSPGGLSDAWVGDCQAYAAGKITLCGQALRSEGLFQNSVLSALGAMASLVLSFIFWG